MNGIFDKKNHKGEYTVHVSLLIFIVAYESSAFTPSKCLRLTECGMALKRVEISGRIWLKVYIF